MSYYQLNSHLTLHADPIDPMHAVTKRYVDDKSGSVDGARFQTGILAVGKLPGLVGEVSSTVGTNVLSLVDSGVTAGAKFRVDVDSKGRVIGGDLVHHMEGHPVSWNYVMGKPTTLSGYGITDVVSTGGGTVSGSMTVGVGPSNSLHAVGKGLVDTTISGLALTAADTGDIIKATTTNTPGGFLRANGGVLDKASYSALYAIIGDTYSNNSGSGSGGYMGQPWRQQYAFNTASNPTTLTWATETPLPATVYLSQAIVTKNRVYLLGGVVGGSASYVVHTAPINADGTLGTWTIGTSLPAYAYSSQAIVTKDRVYLLGGYVSGSASSAVYTAPINADGTLGTWTTEASLPTSVYDSQAIVTKDRVYLLGGVVGSSYSNAVYTAPINADGTLGTWTTGAALPTNLFGTQAIVTKNRVYLLGGYDNGTTSNAVYTAPINPDGTLGTWTTGAALPATTHSSQAIVTKDRVYLLGGYVSGGASNTVYTAPINADGTLGTWTTGTALLDITTYHQAIVTGSKIYTLGNGTGAGNTVHSVDFTGGSNDYLTLIANNTVNSSTQFKLPDFIDQETDALFHYIKY